MNGVRGGKVIIGGVLSVCCGGGVGLFSGVIVSAACKVAYIGYKGAVLVGYGLDTAAVDTLPGLESLAGLFSYHLIPLPNPVGLMIFTCTLDFLRWFGLKKDNPRGFTVK